MTKNSENNFKFWCPIEKAKDIDPTNGEMKLGGIASTSDEDSDGEFLDPKGFDIAPLLQSGMVNWHHQAKGQPGAIIGEPTFAEIRPEGLYIETTLYPSSKIANDVWELAETLEKDSQTRRLGYSIEGKVIKRKSNNKNSPDYRIIQKAIITGVAVTHQPKNPKTFANIIKGEIDEFEDEEEKALDTESGKALKKESVDGKKKNVTFSKSEVIDKIFQDIPAISIEKAQKICGLIFKISNMKVENKNSRTVTDEDISKAYEALGFELPTEDLSKAEDGEEAEKAEDAEGKEKVEKSKEDGEAKEDDEKEGDEKEVKKGGVNRFDLIEKGIATSHAESVKLVKALGVMVKNVSQKTDAVLTENSRLSEIIKSQEDTINMMSERLEAYGSSTPAPKSISSAKVVERAFDKGGNEGEEAIEKGGDNEFSMSKHPRAIADLLDQATFAKGYDEEFSKACTSFEAQKNLPANIIARLKNEFGVNVVK